MTALPSNALTGLAKKLVASTNNRDWPALARLDAEVETLLKALHPVANDLRPALKELQAAHQQARVLVQQESDQLAGRIDRLRHNQEGLKAYEQSEGLA